jgi:hypothetical protein
MEDFEEYGYIEDSERTLMDLFDELSFTEKWERVFKGLKEPKDSGNYKWAKLQMFRLLAPISALVVPVIMLLLISILAKFTPEPTTSVQVKVVEPTPMEELEPIEPPEIEKLEPPDPVEIEVDVATDAPSLPNEAISTAADVASVQPAEFDSVAQIKSPVIMAGIMGSRNPGSRGAALGKYGGSKAGQVAVLRALRWLATQQHSDGSWGKNKPAITAMAVLVYLAHGDTPASEEFGRIVEDGLKFLVDSQEANGRFKGRDGHDYTQPIVAYALSEAYGMTKNPTIRESAVKALEMVVKGQNASGGFNYGLKPSDRDDTSYMGWCVQAMKAGKFAGLSHDVDGLTNAMERAIGGFKKNYGGNDSYGGFGYTGPSDKHGLSGVGVLCLQFLGESKCKEVQNTLPMLQDKWAFNWEDPPNGSVVYYWYYITQAFFQEGGAMWDEWNKSFSPQLTKAQQVISKNESGYVDHKGISHETGFWVSPAAREHNGGNGEVMDTILCALQLTVYYRYLPTFQKIDEYEIEQELGSTDDLIIEII